MGIKQKIVLNIRRVGRLSRYAFIECPWTAYRHIIYNSSKTAANRITFMTFQNGYTCNEKYIAQELIDRKKDVEIFFVVSPEVIAQPEKYGIPDGIKLVQRNKKEHFDALATSKVWVDNAINCVWRSVPKRQDQLYLNTWHGSLGIKKLGGSRGWKHIAKRSNKYLDYFITNSVFEENVFKNSFWPNIPHVKLGHARNDIFFNEEKMMELKKKVYSYYDIEPEAKLFLYAPTFRDNKDDISAIDMDFDKVRAALENRFGGKWVIMSRLHFHNAQNLNTRGAFDGKCVIDACMYPDMQELMAAADIGATDYSSWIFDYIFTGRPSFIYARDIDEYVNSRGFYYPLTETPYSIAGSTEELCCNIENFNDEEYREKCNKFLNDKGCYEDGNASTRIADYILKYMGIE